MINKFKETPGVTKSFECYVSSSTLWFENSSDMKTTISFLDYWKIKNNANVDIEVKTYSMNGSLLKKEYLNFTKGYVKNYSPLNGRNGSGSVEIKIISKNNLRVPYAAIVAIYKTKYGISGVHSYSRTYYNNGEELSDGCEGSWTIRDNSLIESFCVFHNGSKIQPKQEIQLKIQNKKNRILIKNIQLPAMKPYATTKIIIKDHVDNIVDANSMNEAVGFSYQLAEKGDVVLLSPACSSFDMFNNFEHRGEEFKRFVRSL